MPEVDCTRFEAHLCNSPKTVHLSFMFFQSLNFASSGVHHRGYFSHDCNHHSSRSVLPIFDFFGAARICRCTHSILDQLLLLSVCARCQQTRTRVKVADSYNLTRKLPIQKTSRVRSSPQTSNSNVHVPCHVKQIVHAETLVSFRECLRKASD